MLTSSQVLKVCSLKNLRIVGRLSLFPLRQYQTSQVLLWQEDRPQHTVKEIHGQVFYLTRRGKTMQLVTLKPTESPNFVLLFCADTLKTMNPKNFQTSKFHTIGYNLTQHQIKQIRRWQRDKFQTSIIKDQNQLFFVTPDTLEKYRIFTKKSNTHTQYKLMSIYADGSQFPPWSISNEFDADMRLTCVFYNSKDPLNIIQKLVKEREPNNMEMQRMYDMTQMEKVFGWRTGFYHRYFYKYGHVAPNFGVYTFTTVKSRNSICKVHMYHAIGIALDTKAQVDYKYFVAQQRFMLLKEKYTEIFQKIFVCAAKLHLNTIVMSLIGANYFAAKYPGGSKAFRKEIWDPAFLKARDRSILVVFMSLNLDPITVENEEFQSLGPWPQNIQKVNLDSTLFVNSWDPHSVIGNGNRIDDSIDGHVGRTTNAAILGTSMTNPFIQFQKVQL
jgi:hypothetical protein